MSARSKWKFAVNALQKIPVRGKKYPTQAKKKKKKLHKGKKKQCTSLNAACQALKEVISVFTCAIRGSTAAPSSSEGAAQGERESRNITGIFV